MDYMTKHCLLCKDTKAVLKEKIYIMTSD
jgi:hypothetical protein